MKMADNLTHGRVIIGTGRVYSLLDNFVKEEFITETKTESRKKRYIITPMGEDMLEKEYIRINKIKEDY